MIHVQTFLKKSMLRFSDVVYHIHANQSPATHVFVTCIYSSKAFVFIGKMPQN